MLVFLLVTKVIPAIFDQQRLDAQEDHRWNERIQTLPGGTALIEPISARASRGPPLAYLLVDEQRDRMAQDLLYRQRLSIPVQYPTGVMLNCYSSQATTYEQNPTVYQVWLGFDGIASCTCQDFQS